MPGCPRPNKKAMKIAYNVLKIPKDKQQKPRKPSQKKLREWIIDSSNTQ